MPRAKQVPGGESIVTAAEKRRHVMKLKKAGMSYEEIGDKVGYTAQYCRKIVSEVLRQWAAELTDLAAEVVQLEEARLDHMYEALEAKIDQGDTKAITAGLAIMARRAALRGLDQAKKVDLTVYDQTDHELIAAAQQQGIPIPIELLTEAQKLLAHEVINVDSRSQAHPGDPN